MPRVEISLLMTALVSLLGGTTTHSALLPATTDTIINTACSRDPLELAGTSPAQGVRFLQVDFGTDAPGAVNCSWTIPAHSNDSINAIVFWRSDAADWCQQTSISVYDVDDDPASGSPTLVARACGGGRVTVLGRPGLATLVRLEASGMQQRNMTVLSFDTFIPTACPRGGFLFNVTENVTRLHVPRFAGNQSSGCAWKLDNPISNKAPPRHFKVQSPDRSGPGSSASLVTPASFRILGYGYGATNITNVSITEIGVDIYIQTLWFVLIRDPLESDQSSPPFTVTFWSDSAEQMCPSTTLHLSATDQLQTLKGGINGIMHGSTQDRKCWWNITAPMGHTVKLMNIETTDMEMAKLYLKGTSSGEITLPTHTFIDLIFWSEDGSLSLTYEQAAGSEDSAFLASYVIVPRDPCQGQLVELNATGEQRNVSQDAVGANDTTSGTVCRWLIKARTGSYVQATVSANGKQGLCQQRSYRSGIEAHYNNELFFLSDYILSADCVSGNRWSFDTKLYSNVLLIVYNRDPKTSWFTDGVTISYREIPVTSGAVAVTTSLVSMLGLWCVSVKVV